MSILVINASFQLLLHVFFIWIGL